MEEEELQGVKVLVIDDSKTIRRSAENILTREGCDVITATDGFDALAKLVLASRLLKADVVIFFDRNSKVIRSGIGANGAQDAFAIDVEADPLAANHSLATHIVFKFLARIGHMAGL